AGTTGHLLSVTPRARYGFSTQGSNYELYGDKYVRVPNRPDAIAIYYYLGQDIPRATITIKDASNQSIAQLIGPTAKGLHVVNWNLGGGRGGGGPIAPGTYTAEMSLDGTPQITRVVVRERIPPRR